MANRALLAKAARAVEQRRELGNAEYLKPAYVSAFRISRNELAQLCDGVMVTKVEPGAARGLQRRAAGWSVRQEALASIVSLMYNL